MAMVYTDIRSLASKSAKVSLLKFPVSSAGLCCERQNNMLDWTKKQVQLRDQPPRGIVPSRESCTLDDKEEEVEVPSICPAGCSLDAQKKVTASSVTSVAKWGDSVTKRLVGKTV